MESLVTEENIADSGIIVRLTAKSVILFCWVDEILQEEIS